MELLRLTSLSKTYELIMEKIEQFNQFEFVDICDSLDRISYEDIYSIINVPTFNRSTVDGYSVLSKDTFYSSDSLPTPLNYVGAVEMGQKNYLTIRNNETVYVPTGGMMPFGADANVMIENTELLSNDVLIYKPVVPKENVLLAGEDIKSGQIILNVKSRIVAKDIGMLASCGIKTIKVYKKPKVSIISTGDEITDNYSLLEEGKIFDINTYTIDALSKEAGLEVIYKKLVIDELDPLVESIKYALNNSDIIIVSGGSSQGDKDNTKKAIELIEKDSVFVHGISIKPGKPTILASVKGKPVIGLPGQPTSSFLIFHIVVNYILKNRLYVNGLIYCKTSARLKYNVFSSPGKTTILPVNIEKIENENFCSIVKGKSGMITTVGKSDGFIILDENSEGLLKDTLVEVYLFR